ALAAPFALRAPREPAAPPSPAEAPAAPPLEEAWAALEADTAALDSAAALVRLEAALTRPADGERAAALLAYELLLLDEPVAAGERTATLPPGPLRAGLEALARLALGRPAEVPASGPQAPRPRLVGYASLLAGDHARAEAALAGREDRAALAVTSAAANL